MLFFSSSNTEVYLWFVNAGSLFVLSEELSVNSEKATTEYATKYYKDEATAYWSKDPIPSAGHLFRRLHLVYIIVLKVCRYLDDFV